MFSINVRKEEASLPDVPLILLIEDEPGDAALVSFQLKEQSRDAFRIHHAESLSAAAELLASESIEPDLVLLDLNLPDSSGTQTVERCRALTEAPIVVLTGLDDIEATRLSIESGADDYLPKGGDGGSLRRAIRYAILRHRRDNDERIAATVFTHAREGIILTEPDGTIIDVNEAFTRITGYSRQEAIGRNPRFLQSGRHDAAFYLALWHQLLDEGSWSGEIWNRRRDGAVYIELLTISAVKDLRGRVRHFVALFSDITTQKENQAQLEYFAHHDSLTGLPNRILFADRLAQAVASAARRAESLALLYIDLDGFKPVNDQFGHQAGDLLLIEVAKRMQQILRESDTLARIGGDEFVAVLTDFQPSRDRVVRELQPLLERLLESISAPYELHINEQELQAVRVTASIGVVIESGSGGAAPATLRRGDELLRYADEAMYRAKTDGKGRYHISE